MSIRAVGGTYQAGKRLLALPRPDVPSGSPEEAIVESAVESSRLLLPPVAQADAPQTARWHYRPAAPFVAHVIATFQGHPQTRHRGRASGGDAATAYGNVSECHQASRDVGRAWPASKMGLIVSVRFEGVGGRVRRVGRAGDAGVASRDDLRLR